jgi:hypothetical protein
MAAIMIMLYCLFANEYVNADQHILGQFSPDLQTTLAVILGECRINRCGKKSHSLCPLVSLVNFVKGNLPLLSNVSSGKQSTEKDSNLV